MGQNIRIRRFEIDLLYRSGQSLIMVEARFRTHLDDWSAAISLRKRRTILKYRELTLQKLGVEDQDLSLELRWIIGTGDRVYEFEGFGGND